ncbi:MAG: M23 family metallopeptidase [Hyphomicrobium sp.]
MAVRDVYSSDSEGRRQGGGFRWLVSTCLAAAVGTVAILVIIYGSSSQNDGADGLLPTLKRMSEGVPAPDIKTVRRGQEGLRWQVPRTDRLQFTTAAMSTRYTIHEMLRQRVAGRDKIYAKRYLRIVGKLTPVPGSYADVIPPFNPLRLFANNNPVGTEDQDAERAGERSEVMVKVVELLGGILPQEDGQELAPSEVADIVARSESAAAGADVTDAAGGALTSGAAGAAEFETSLNTSILPKSTFDADDDRGSDDEAGKRIQVKVAAGDTLNKILTAAGADKWLVQAMTEATEKVFPLASLAQGQVVELTLVPSLTVADRMEPGRFSIYAATDGSDRQLLVAVSRSAAGEFVASADGGSLAEDARPGSADGEAPQTGAGLYASLYYANLLQNVPPDTILQILKVHAYDTDYRRRIRAGDQIELFFDPKDETAPDGAPGELLCSAITTGGETAKFYRYRTSDGAVDFYDAAGNNSKKFLMRRPVRGDDVRLTSGYGVRFHPLLNERKMHTGVDWAAPPGTPILAAGTGTVEEVGRKGQYGNYIRIRHANGYQTAYGHMSRFAEGVVQGVKVRQGQVIGFVGSTGLSSGPHLHFEVLINTRLVDPMSVPVPRERQLSGKDLTDFQKERLRIDDLMRRAPVKTEMRASR